MMHVEQIITGIHKFIDTRVEMLVSGNPMLSLAQPFIKRGVTKQVDKYTGSIRQYLVLLADDDGNLDIDTITDEITTRFNEMPTTTINTDMLGEVKLGQGKVEFEVSLPFTSPKVITFTSEDIADLKKIITQQ